MSHVSGLPHARLHVHYMCHIQDMMMSVVLLCPGCLTNFIALHRKTIAKFLSTMTYCLWTILPYITSLKFSACV